MHSPNDKDNAMEDSNEITLTLAERKHANAFGLKVFCREFDGWEMAWVCVGAVGQENRIAALKFGDYLIYELDNTRYEIRLIEAKATKSDPQAVILVSRLPGPTDTQEKE